MTDKEIPKGIQKLIDAGKVFHSDKKGWDFYVPVSKDTINVMREVAEYTTKNGGDQWITNEKVYYKLP